MSLLLFKTLYKQRNNQKLSLWMGSNTEGENPPAQRHQCSLSGGQKIQISNQYVRKPSCLSSCLVCLHAFYNRLQICFHVSVLSPELSCKLYIVRDLYSLHILVNSSDSLQGWMYRLGLWGYLQMCHCFAHLTFHQCHIEP